MIGASITAIYSLKDTPFGIVYTLSVERFERDNDGAIKGNSRARESENAKVAFEESPLLGIGIDMERQTSNNYLSLFASYGVIGYILVQIPIFYFLLKFILTKNSHHKWVVLKCMFILLLNLQQRPLNTNVVYFLSILLVLVLSNQLLYKNHQKSYAF